ncbi:retrotransposon protein, putative, ty1-copia subclass [Tanacetum coccineum]|uniref:Retrotransposon protein, putative, ty1-copia subclass n=1 Tax=Tanacetum coccineum TaxID=301880 RepID=A0ABQ4X325_9ASTR
MVEQNRGEHLIRRFAGRGNEPDPRNDDGSEDVNPFGRGNHGFHDNDYDNPLLTNEIEIEPIIWDIGDEEEEYPFVNKYPSFEEEPIVLVEEESCPVYNTDNDEEESIPLYDTDIEDVIEEEEGFVGKGGISGEEDNIEDDVVVANDICSSKIQTNLNVDVEEDINTKSHELMLFGKKYYYQDGFTCPKHKKFDYQAECKLVRIEQPLPPTPLPAEHAAVVDAYFTLFTTSTHNKKWHEPGVSLILNYLSKDYEQFMQNYIVHSMGKTIDMLHAMLKLDEKAAKGKRNGKDKVKQAYAPKLKIPPPAKKEHIAMDSICHKCGEGLRGILKMKQGALNLYVGNGMRAAVEVIGSFDLILHNGLIIVLVSCHYAHTITRCVVSLSRLVDNGFIHKFTNYGISISKDNVNYFNDIPRDGIYKIDMHNLVPNVSSIYNVINKRTKHNLDSTYLWHCRLGHIKKKHIAKLQHDGLLKSTNDESFDKCISCISRKMVHKPFPHEKERAKDLLGLIHIDVCGPFRTMSREGAS